MAIFIHDLRLVGTAYLQARSAEEANLRLAELYPICMDVNDHAWFSSNDWIYLSSGLTVDKLVKTQSPARVTRRAMNETMRWSVRGEKVFWLPARDLRAFQTKANLYCVDIDLIGTAFV